MRLVNEAESRFLPGDDTNGTGYGEPVVLISGGTWRADFILCNSSS